MNLTLDTIRDIKLYQNKNGYRFSVDALLLYSFVNPVRNSSRCNSQPSGALNPDAEQRGIISNGVNLRRAYRIADMGAGSGIVGILLAKKYRDSEVALIEIQDSLARLAEKNVLLNNLKKRIYVVKADIKTLTPPTLPLVRGGIRWGHFDLVVSNPPFRRQKTGLISPTDEKAVARHEIELKLADLIQASCSLLRSKGRFCMVYHPSRLVELIDALREKHLEPKRLRFVHSTLITEAKMVLVEAIKDGKAEMKIEKPLYIYKEDGTYTDEMKALY